MRFTFLDTPEPLYVHTDEDAQDLADIMRTLPRLGFDTETTGLDKVRARVKFFSFGFTGTRFCAPVRLLHHFADILEDPHIEKCLTNAKFDMHMIANHGIELRGTIFDTVPMDWLFDENRTGRHGLKQCAADHLGLKMAPFSEVFGSVGAVDTEVETMCRMHDALELGSTALAVELLSFIGKLEVSDEILEDMKTLSKKLGLGRKDPLRLSSASQLLRIARKHRLCPTTRGKSGHVSDFCELLGFGAIPSQEREDFVGLAGDPRALVEAHEIILDHLSRTAQSDRTPLDTIRLMVGDYASLDAWASFELTSVLEKKLSKEFIQPGISLLDYYHDTTAPMIGTLWRMERRGFQLDIGAAQAVAEPMLKDIERLERDFVSMVGKDVNPNSPAQLVDIFFTKKGDTWEDPFGKAPWKWSTGGSTGKKRPSISKEVIEEWAEQGNDLARCLQEHRVLQKLHSTYIDALPRTVDSRDRIHTDLKQAGTVTGRLSSGDPNLQNIPARGEWGRRIRQFFVAGYWGSCDDWCMDSLRDVPLPQFSRDEPMTLIVADYEQLEMRIMAHMSGDPTMIATIREGKDLHSMTGALAVGADYAEITAAKKAEHPTPEQIKLVELRSHMKAVGFGLLYGIGAKKLGQQLGLKMVPKYARNGQRFDTCPEAEALIEKYFSIYPKVLEFIDDTHYLCQDQLYVQTILGRFRRLPDILSRDKGLAKQAERQSVNSRIQGSAADIVNRAMLNCEGSPELRRCGVRMLMQIHDELVFEAPARPDLLERAKVEIRRQMENPYPMEVPILISMDAAHSWGDAK